MISKLSNMKVVNYGTFKVDHILRSISGSPIGRAIMFDENMYSPGVDVINVSVLRVPIIGDPIGIKGFQCYIDGLLYEVPKDLKNIHITKKPDSFIVTNVCLYRKVDNG